MRRTVYGAPRVLQPRYVQQRLMHWLDHAWGSGAPLILLRGYEGSGKSTLLSIWLEQTAQDVSHTVWIYPSGSDLDGMALWRHIVRQFVASGSLDANSELADRILNDNLPQHIDIREWAVEQLNSLPHTLNVVIDNFSMLSQAMDDRLSEEFYWLAQRTRNLRCIILTDNPPNPDHLTLLRELSVPELTERELRFTLQEVEDFYTTELGASAEAITLLYESLAGEVRSTANVIRTLQRLKPEARTIAELRRIIDEQLDTQFANIQTVLSGREELLQLQRLAVPDYLTDELIATISPVEHTDATLRYAEEHGIASWRNTEGGRVFTFVPELRERLRADFVREHPEEYRRTQQLVSHWLVDAGDLQRAIRCMVDIEDWQALSFLIVTNPTKIRMLHFPQVLAILRAMPAKRLIKYPVFAFMLAIADNANPNLSLDRVLHFANLGLSAIGHFPFRKADDDPVYDWWSHFVLASTNVLFGRFSAVSEHAHKSLTAIHSLIDQATTNQQRSIIADLTSHSVMLLFLVGEVELAEEQSHTILSAEQHLPGKSSSYGYTHALSNIAYLQARRGQYAELMTSLEATQDSSLPAGWQHDFLAWGYSYAQARLALDRLDIETARRYQQLMDPHFSTHMLWVELYELQVYTDLLADNAYAAALNLGSERKQRKKRHPVSSHSEALLASYTSILLLAADRIEEAEQALSPYATHSSLDLILSRSLLAMVQGECELAKTLASTVIWSDHASLRQTAHGLLLKATAQYRLNNHAEALQFFENALQIITEHGLTSALMFAPQQDLRGLWSQQCEYPISLLERIPDHFSKANQNALLTNREFEILKELDSNLSIAEIADKHYVSRNTVKAQLRSIYRKLEVTSREHAVSVAYARGILNRITSK